MDHASFSCFPNSSLHTTAPVGNSHEEIARPIATPDGDVSSVSN